MTKIEIPDLAGKALFKWLVDNESKLIAMKKAEIKHADGIRYTGPLPNISGKIVEAAKGRIIKAAADGGAQLKNELEVDAVINTTYWLDSHGDVHIDGLWKRSLSHNKMLVHLEEHVMSFRNLITDVVKGYTQKIPWKELGVDFEGSTEALVFDSKIKRDKFNTDMFDRYAAGKVKQHSVGMRYRKILLAINDEDDYPEYYEIWKKYASKIANQDELQDVKWFWAVTEAEVIEGSAVLLGSNSITPTQSVKHTGSEKSTQPVPRKQSTQVKAALSVLQSQINSLVK